MIMKNKLILDLDENLIVLAQRYAQAKQMSLSVLVENYLRKVTAEPKPHSAPAGSRVKRLSGIVKLQQTRDDRDAYFQFLAEKNR